MLGRRKVTQNEKTSKLRLAIQINNGKVHYTPSGIFKGECG
jgi:hypothetical protein